MFGLCFLWELLTEPPDKITLEWQTVVIGGFGSFRVPAEWNVEERDRILYITDKPLADDSCTIYIVGTSERDGIPLQNLFIGVEWIGSSRYSRLLDNGGHLFFYDYMVNGTKQEHCTIGFDISNGAGGYGDSYNLFVWNREVVDEYITQQIAKTVSIVGELDHPNFGLLEQ